VNIFPWFLNFFKLGIQVAIGPEQFFLANIGRETNPPYRVCILVLTTADVAIGFVSTTTNYKSKICRFATK
jgi:hypothetical protein